MTSSVIVAICVAKPPPRTDKSDQNVEVEDAHTSKKSTEKTNKHYFRKLNLFKSVQLLVEEVMFFMFCTSQTRNFHILSFIKSILLLHNLLRLLLYRKVPWRPEGMWIFLFIPCIFLRVWVNWVDPVKVSHEKTKRTCKTDNVLSVIAVVHSRLCEKPENRSWRWSQRFLDTRSRY